MLIVVPEANLIGLAMAAKNIAAFLAGRSIHVVARPGR
jgi:hypothetical protein